MMDAPNKPKPTLGAYLVGVYLFSVPAFAYTTMPGLLVIPQITGIALVAYALIDILASQRIRIPREIQLYGLFGLWALITFYLVADVGETGTLSLGTLLKVVVATLACAQLIKSETDLFLALKIFVFSVLFVYVQNRGDLQYMRIADKLTEMDRFAGTLTNPNTAATFSLTVIWACIFLFLRSRKRLLNWALLAPPVAISLLIIYYSGSKKGLIGIGLFAVFLTRLMYIRERSSVYRKAFIVLVSACLIVVAGYFIYTSPFFVRMEQLISGISGSDINRLNLAREAVEVWLTNFKTFFLGVGYDNFRLFSSLQAYSHSTPLELLSSNGIIGFTLFMSLLFLLFRKFVYLYRQTVSQELKSLFFSTLIFLLIYVAFMLAAVLHDSRELLPILGCLAAFGQYHLHLLEQNRAGESPGPPGENAAV